MKIKSIVSSFLAVAIAMTATTALTSIDASAEDYGTAWVMFTGTDERTEKDKGSSDNVDATITKDGSYTATAVAAPAEKLQLLVLQTDLKDTDYPDVKITVDSITVNGVAVEYTQSDDAFKMEEDMGYRVNILNTLGSDAVKDIAEDVELPEGDGGNATIEVSFSVSGLESSDSSSSDSESTSESESSSSDSSSSDSESSSSDSSSSESESSSSDSSSSDSSSSDSDSTSSVGSDLESVETSSSSAETTTTASDLGVTPSTGVAGVAGLVTLSALATGAVVISRKKR
jgi:hypothetical protein